MSTLIALVDFLMGVVAPCVLILTPLVALVIHFIAYSRRGGGDTGDHWARIVLTTCIFAGLVLASGFVESISTAWWQKGWHFQWDLVRGFRYGPRVAYLMALLVPLFLWVVAAFISALVIGERSAARWLAGAVGVYRRPWVLWCTVPLLVALFWPLLQGDLNSGTAGYPAAAWTTNLLLVCSLVGVAISRPAPVFQAKKKVVTKEEKAPAMLPWPEAMAAEGVAVESLARWQQTADPPEVHPAQKLVDAVNAFTKPGVKGNTLVLGPDHCGQVEALAEAAKQENLKHQAMLVIVAEDAPHLGQQLKRHLDGVRVSTLSSGQSTPQTAEVLIVEAEVLSNRLSQVLKTDDLQNRLGLVVWWNAHEYSGVMAANIWAVSRRFQRLVEARPHGVANALIFARQNPHGRAQQTRFIRRLLPYQIDQVVDLETRLDRTIELHLLGSHGEFLDKVGTIDERNSHLPLVASLASVRTRWPTYLGRLDEVDIRERQAVLSLDHGKGNFNEALSPSVANAGARVLEIHRATIFALEEMVASGGRAFSGETHHVALVPPESPYVAYLLSCLDQKGFGTSRRLVSSEGNERITERHIIAALAELPDTRMRLLQTFQWEEEMLVRILDHLASRERLDQREVRYIDNAGDLQVDMYYESRQAVEMPRQPLHTVGTDLVEVREFAAAGQRQVRMYVDPERLVIAAYPERRFFSDGRRYRIRDWSEGEISRRWIECEHDETSTRTWRLRSAAVANIEIKSGPVYPRVGHQAIGRYQLELSYEETVTGVLTQVLHPRRGPQRPTDTRYSGLRTEFNAQALFIDFPSATPYELASVAAALTAVIPAHIGVERNSLAVVWVLERGVEDRLLNGLAIVDLFPGGVGLVDAFWQENELLLDLLRFAHQWLVTCPCEGDGCEKCLFAPELLAAFPQRWQTRTDALTLLGRVVREDAQ
ncbi:MAG: DUF1998 domain-containing protein [Proteobacteria bacterium]|nr:DUF1998 domain-containing protein [Pseudomonadota bacterium]